MIVRISIPPPAASCLPPPVLAAPPAPPVPYGFHTLAFAARPAGAEAMRDIIERADISYQTSRFLPSPRRRHFRRFLFVLQASHHTTIDLRRLPRQPPG